MFGCAWSLLRHWESLVVACELLVAACGMKFPHQGVNLSPQITNWTIRQVPIIATSPLKYLLGIVFIMFIVFCSTSMFIPKFPLGANRNTYPLCHNSVLMSLEGLMLKLKLQYFGHLIQRADSFEKTLMLGKIEGRRRRWRQRMNGWMASPTRWTWVLVNSGSWWWTGRPGVMQFMGSQRVGHNWATELNWEDWKEYQFSQSILSLSKPSTCIHNNESRNLRTL